MILYYMIWWSLHDVVGDLILYDLVVILHDLVCLFPVWSLNHPFIISMGCISSVPPCKLDYVDLVLHRYFYFSFLQVYSILEVVHPSWEKKASSLFWLVTCNVLGNTLPLTTSNFVNWNVPHTKKQGAVGTYQTTSYNNNKEHLMNLNGWKT